MQRHDIERWHEDFDLDRAHASPRCIAAAWTLVAIIVAMMSFGPLAVKSVEIAMAEAKHELMTVRDVLACTSEACISGARSAQTHM